MPSICLVYGFAVALGGLSVQGSMFDVRPPADPPGLTDAAKRASLTPLEPSLMALLDPDA